MRVFNIDSCVYTRTLANVKNSYQNVFKMRNLIYLDLYSYS